MRAAVRRGAWLFCIAGAVAVFAATFALTEQTPEETTALSQAAERRVASAVAVSSEIGASGTSQCETGTSSEGAVRADGGFLNPIVAQFFTFADIRAWAHVPEFFAQGVFLFGTAVLWPCEGREDGRACHPRAGRRPLKGRLAFALACCVACSLFDQTHKAFVPGREFDARDLLFDAAGYLLALAIVVLVVGVARFARTRTSDQVRYA